MKLKEEQFELYLQVLGLLNSETVFRQYDLDITFECAYLREGNDNKSMSNISKIVKNEGESLRNFGYSH